MLPTDDHTDPNIYVEETLTFELPETQTPNQLASFSEMHVEWLSKDDMDVDMEDNANKVAMAMMLNGEHPDNEIDKLLETFGV